MTPPFHVPSLVDSATILACVAALIAIPIAWRTYVDDERRNRDAIERGIQNVIDGLRPEMRLVRALARGPDGQGPGYPGVGDDSSGEDIKTFDYYWEERPDWQNPLPGVKPFACPAIRQITVSPYVSHLGPLVEDFAVLSAATAALEVAEADRRAFVLSRPDLLMSISKFYTEKRTDFTQEQREYMKIVFFKNFSMYVQLIGSAETVEDNALFKAHHFAQVALDQFESSWRAQLSRPGRIHSVANVVSMFMVVGAVIIFVAWFWQIITPLPEVVWAGVRQVTGR